MGGAAVAAAFLVVAPGVAAAQPVNPSDAQIAAAQTAKDAAAAQVGAIQGQLSALRSAAASAHQQAVIAGEDYEQKQAAFDAARTAADAATAASDAADAHLAEGRAAVVQFARESYMQGTTDPGMTALLSAGGPGELVERAALLDAAGEHRTDVVAQLTVLQTQATAAEQTATQAVDQAATLKTEAEQLLTSAQAQEVSARAQAADVEQQSTALQAQLDQASQTLYGVQGARKVAEQYAAQQAAAAAARPTATRASAPAAAPSSSSTPARSTAGSSSSGSSSSGGSSSGGSSSVGGSAGSASGGDAGAPSSTAVQKAIAAAKSQIGVLYSWGGGGSNGPGYGIPPDTDVFGFDCSGLTQYAYAKAGISIGGTSRDQWWLNRGKQVDADDLQAGDLLFYASGSNYNSIYHVALYIGGNQMIEAPDRGLTVMTSKLRFGSDYFGAVRPSA